VTGTVAAGQKQRRVSLALPSSPRLVPAWNFRDDTSVPYADAARKGKVRRIDTSADDEDDDTKEEWEIDGEEKGEDGDAVTIAPGAPEKGKEKEKKVRRKWTPEETQMLVDGCNIVSAIIFLRYDSFFLPFESAFSRFRFFLASPVCDTYPHVLAPSSSNSPSTIFSLFPFLSYFLIPSFVPLSLH
jgi:hypothetical protein